MNIKTNKTFPFVSIVVVTFNRSALIIACLESIRHQTYPHDRYEIIVVDDHSTDDTVAILKSHSARVIQHDVNRGIPTARNTGLAAAKGEIIAYIDDDAVADPAWLEHLIRPFNDPDVTASGGYTFPYKTEYFAERYLTAVSYGNPAPIGFGKSKNPLRRFFVYIKSMFQSESALMEPTEVQAVYGLNCAFRTAALKTAGGFDEQLLADEDSEICTRLRLRGARIMFTPNAVIHHRHRENIIYLIRQTYRRSQYTTVYYAKERKVLPIFPLPVLYIIFTILLVIFYFPIGITFAVIGPLLLYSWWPVKAIKKSNPEYTIYGYVQLVLESAAIVGMARGEINLIRQ